MPTENSQPTKQPEIHRLLNDIFNQVERSEKNGAAISNSTYRIGEHPYPETGSDKKEDQSKTKQPDTVFEKLSFISNKMEENNQRLERIINHLGDLVGQ